MAVGVAGLASAQQAPRPPGSLSPGGARATDERQNLPTVESPTVVIPPVSAGRPLEADEGPKVRVTQIDLQVEPALAASAGPETVAAANALVRSQLTAQPGGEFGIRQLELVAESVTRYFREQGFALATAYLPAQDVAGGKVRIGVLGGELGQVKVEGNNRYSTERLVAPFGPLLGQPVRVDELDTGVLRLRDYPGLTPAAVLSPGQRVGTTDLTLRVDERPLEFDLAGDNYGNYTSGEYRATGGMAWNNPTGLGDRLRLEVTQAFEPSENTYGRARYEVPVETPTVIAYADYSVSAYDIGSSESREIFEGDDIVFDLDGKSRVADFGLLFRPIRTPDFNLELELGGAIEMASFLSPGIEGPGSDSDKREDDLFVWHFGARLEGVDTALFGTLGLNDLGFRVERGLSGVFGAMESSVGYIEGTRTCQSTRQAAALSGTDPKCAGGDFTTVAVSYQRVQQLTENNAFVFRGLYQWSNSDDLLTSLHQVALGGPYSVRAYPVAQALIDQGGQASIEWIYDIGNLGFLASDRWDISVFLFGDYGGGTIFDGGLTGPDGAEQIADRNVDLAGWGGGTEITFRTRGGMRIVGRLDVSTNVTDDEAESYDDDDPRVWGSLIFKYR
jgi:hemolysin activation/secretion protein